MTAEKSLSVTWGGEAREGLFGFRKREKEKPKEVKESEDSQ